MEYIYYQMAIAAGIEMMPSCIQTFGSMCNFITKRFDRIGDAKIHTQTLAAMNPFADNYDDLFAIIRQLNLPYKDSEQQFLRMVFNVLSRNVDDHFKNFSFCMDQEGKWYLSPAYDITYTIDHSAPNYINNQSFLVNGKDDDITMQDLLEVAKRNDISEAKVLIEKVQESLSRFRLLAQELEVPIQIVNQIEKDISL
ncbi:MAG: HipA domain-containing protein [Bacteroidales bacterium]